MRLLPMLRLLGVLAHHRPRARWLLSVVGIALGVALGYAVHLVNGAAVQEVTAGAPASRSPSTRRSRACRAWRG